MAETKIKIKLYTKATSTENYMIYVDKLFEWLRSRNILHHTAYEEWHSLPTHVYIDDQEDALAFRLTFGL